uniref:DUF2202 domain-containing protein n=1 Tax=Magnetococcus massalia (strain MO-1) TaxID=451514 RepID=A0A1S7LE60_MAGMO|nr:Conserved protein of unknown function [Candidatus Magnetococcus massalia]
MEIEDWEPDPKSRPKSPSGQEAVDGSVKADSVTPVAESSNGLDELRLDELGEELPETSAGSDPQALSLDEVNEPAESNTNSGAPAQPQVESDKADSEFSPFGFIKQGRACKPEDCDSCEDAPPIASVSKERPKYSFVGVFVGIVVLAVVLLQVLQSVEGQKFAATLNSLNGLLPTAQPVAMTTPVGPGMANQTPCGQPVAMGGATTPCGQPVAFGMGGVLTPTEKRYLIYMREEEKLARDVYLHLYDTWRVAIFRSISLSEQRHMDAILRMLTRYGLEDPVGQDVRGRFQDRDLRELYQKLIKRGERSLGEALKVGGLVEELDISDLNKAMRETSAQDVTRVYQSIQRGSFNHLRSFAHGVELRGQRYRAQKLSQKQVSTILHAPMDMAIDLGK